ncbi:MAG TPA: site-2 protease family protein [Stellaceae bacterium]|nr:site-2 protease family protein [Stellaceae bacterium]
MNGLEDQLDALVQQISIFALPAIFAITFHEAAHGFVAHRLGDDTAFRMGRVTFNPLRHIDLYGTILLPIFLLLISGGRFVFGFAKPVPVNFGALRHPRRDMVWVAIAGPGINIALAVASALLFYLVPYVPALGRDWARDNLEVSVVVNVILAVFNLIPLPPLDGGRVAVGLLPDFLAFPLARLERYGILILIALLIFLPMLGDRVGVNLDVVRYVINFAATYVMHGIISLTGAG